MSSWNQMQLFLPRRIRELPLDLGVALAALAVTDIFVLIPVLNETPLRIVFGLPLVLFVPGYLFVAALFPEAGKYPSESEDQSAETGPETSGIDGVERIALSFGLSIALVPLIGLVLNFTPWGIRLIPILISLNAFSVGVAVFAARRRWQLPEPERLSVPFRKWLSAVRVELLQPSNRANLVLNVLLVLSVLLAAGSVTYAVAAPTQGEHFSGFYLLTETDDGNYVADEFPTDFTVGDSRSIVIGISNHEHERAEYTVVSVLQRVETADDSTRILDQQELGRLRVAVGHNDTAYQKHQIQPTTTGSDLRLTYLLYKSEVPANPTVENAYRDTHLWINVSAN